MSASVCPPPLRSAAANLLPQMGNPLAFGANLSLQKTHHLAAPRAQIQRTGKPREALFTRSQPLISLSEDSAAVHGTQHAEQSDAQMEAAPGSYLSAREMAQASQQFLPAFFRKRVNFSRLAALAGTFALADPAALYKSPQERIDKIVVHLASPGNQPHLLLERVPVLGSTKQVGQQQ